MSKIFGENLRRLREQAGYKQAKEFAAVVGVPYTTYSSYEKLGREPRYEVLCKIAEALSVSIDELLGYNTPSEERDLFAECKTLIESIGMDGEPLLVSNTRHLDEKEYPGIVIQRGGELGYPFARFSSRAEFIAFVQGIMHDFEQSGIYLNARQQFVENALRKEEQRQAEARKKDAEQRNAIIAPSLKEVCERALQYYQSKEWPPDEPDEAEGAKSLIEFLTKMLHRVEDEDVDRLPITSQEAVLKEELEELFAKNLRKAEDKATNRPPATSPILDRSTEQTPPAGNKPILDSSPADAPQSGNLPPLPESKQAIGQNSKLSFDTDKQPRTKKRQKKSAPHKDEAPDK